jgi:hypothetical protein
MFQEMAEKLAEYEALAEALPGQSGLREDMDQRILHLGLSRTKLEYEFVQHNLFGLVCQNKEIMKVPHVLST